MPSISRGCLVGVCALLALAAPARAQDSKSAVLAKELAAALDASKADSIAAKDASTPGVYLGALYIPGVQLLVISGTYTAPALLDDQLFKKAYRDIYIELNAASAPGSKRFVEDMGSNGVSAKRDDLHVDAYESGGKRTVFDGDWKKQKLSEDEYMKAYAEADEQYAKMLTALLAQLKKPAS